VNKRQRQEGEGLRVAKDRRRGLIRIGKFAVRYEEY